MTVRRVQGEAILAQPMTVHPTVARRVRTQARTAVPRRVTAVVLTADRHLLLAEVRTDAARHRTVAADRLPVARHPPADTRAAADTPPPPATAPAAEVAAARTAAAATPIADIAN
jgi:hypothetical protein